jgi:hypothetical protein
VVRSQDLLEGGDDVVPGGLADGEHPDLGHIGVIWGLRIYIIGGRGG